MNNFRKGFDTTLGVITAMLTANLIIGLANSLVGNKEKKSEEEKED